MNDNRVRLTGRLCEAAQLRYSPAGVPIARFLLEHESIQEEGGMNRPIRMWVGVRAAGDPIARQVSAWPEGTQVTVVGFLARARQRDGDNRLIISAVRVIGPDGDADTNRE
ncbi:primosomal replication protein N [Arhodomonas sp. AD133]|uniref:primosomal replication protein N n=1 Tax=Arhodomonas sp. AD133 TaxID=3415009 RepID=UPI003EB8AB65